MKSFSKKLISLMLVALMLVAAMPMAAFADEADVQADAGTPVVVEDGSNTYNESGSSSDQVAMQDAPAQKKNSQIIVSGDYSKTGTASIYQDVDDRGEDYVKEVLKSFLGSSTAKNYDLVSYTWDKDTSTLEIEVSLNSDAHTKHTMVLVKEDSSDTAHLPTDEVHYYVCSVCGYVETERHDFKYSYNANGHTATCRICNHKVEEDHTYEFYKDAEFNGKAAGYKTTDPEGETVTVLTAAKEADCKNKATYAKIKYDCGYSVGGESYGALGDHDYGADGKCKVCGRSEDGETDYTVNIIYTKGGATIVSGSARLTKTEVSNIRANLDGAKKVLKVTKGSSDDDQKTIDAYVKSISSCYVTMDADGVYNIYVNADLTPGSESNVVTKGRIRIINGTDDYERDLVVGRYYFDQIKISDNNRELVAMEITKNDGTTTRTIYKGTVGTDARVQDDDRVCKLIWDANIVTINFYRNAGGNSLRVSTMQIRAGETIDSLPLLDGQKVTWYLPSGEPLQEGRVYDFKDKTVNVYPKSGTGSSEVYLLIYKNGDTKTAIDSVPVNVTQYVQANGYISKTDLTSVIKKKISGDKIYIFDYEGWEEYKDAKNTNSQITQSVKVGTDADRGNVFLYAMVTGASGSSSSKADSSNPKTGDTAMIGTAFAVMAVAAIGLGTATVVLKKKEEF